MLSIILINAAGYFFDSAIEITDKIKIINLSLLLNLFQFICFCKKSLYYCCSNYLVATFCYLKFLSISTYLSICFLATCFSNSCSFYKVYLESIYLLIAELYNLFNSSFIWACLSAAYASDFILFSMISFSYSSSFFFFSTSGINTPL